MARLLAGSVPGPTGNRRAMPTHLTREGSVQDRTEGDRYGGAPRRSHIRRRRRAARSSVDPRSRAWPGNSRQTRPRWLSGERSPSSPWDNAVGQCRGGGVAWQLRIKRGSRNASTRHAKWLARISSIPSGCSTSEAASAPRPSNKFILRLDGVHHSRVTPIAGKDIGKARIVLAISVSLALGPNWLLSRGSSEACSVAVTQRAPVATADTTERPAGDTAVPGPAGRCLEHPAVARELETAGGVVVLGTLSA